VDIDGPGAAEVVVTPDLLEQVIAGENAARMLHEEFQQLELLEREVKDTRPQPRRVRRLVDRQVPGTYLVGSRWRGARLAADGQPQPGLHLRRASGVQ
jgi:hypothetical protein